MEGKEVKGGGRLPPCFVVRTYSTGGVRERREKRLTTTDSRFTKEKGFHVLYYTQVQEDWNYAKEAKHFFVLKSSQEW